MACARELALDSKAGGALNSKIEVPARVSEGPEAGLSFLQSSQIPGLLVSSSFRFWFLQCDGRSVTPSAANRHEPHVSAYTLCIVCPQSLKNKDPIQHISAARCRCFACGATFGYD